MHVSDCGGGSARIHVSAASGLAGDAAVFAVVFVIWLMWPIAGRVGPVAHTSSVGGQVLVLRMTDLAVLRKPTDGGISVWLLGF